MKITLQMVVCIFVGCANILSASDEGDNSLTTTRAVLSVEISPEYWEFLARAPALRTIIQDHNAFSCYLKEFDPMQPDVENNLHHISWLQTILRGSDNWNDKHISMMRALWGYFADRQVLPQADDAFPFQLMFSAIKNESFKKADDMRYGAPFRCSAVRCSDTSCASEASRFLVHYLKAVYEGGQKCREKWVVLYPGYISGQLYAQGYELKENEVESLVQAKTYQFDAREIFIELMQANGIDYYNVQQAHTQEPSTLRFQINDVWKEINVSAEVFSDLDGIFTCYPEFDLTQDVASLIELNVPTGYVQPMCHVQHPNPSIRWVAISCAVDWVLNMSIPDDPLRCAPSSFLVPGNKLACLLMLYEQGLIVDEPAQRTAAV